MDWGKWFKNAQLLDFKEKQIYYYQFTGTTYRKDFRLLTPYVEVRRLLIFCVCICVCVGRYVSVDACMFIYTLYTHFHGKLGVEGRFLPVLMTYILL